MFHTLKNSKFKRTAALWAFSICLSFSGNIQASNLQENEDLYGTCEKRLTAVRSMFSYTPTEVTRKQNYKHLEQAITPYILTEYPTPKESRSYTFDARFNLLSKIMETRDPLIKRLAYKGFELEITSSLKSDDRLSAISPIKGKIETKDPILAALKNACVSNGTSTYMHKKDFSTMGSKKAFTLSFWLKRNTGGGSYQYLFNTDKNGSLKHYIDFLILNDKLVYGLLENDFNPDKKSIKDFIAFESWKHLVFSINSDEAVDQMKLYLDGERVPVEKRSSTYDHIKQFQDIYGLNNNSYLCVHGRYAESRPNIISGYMAHVYGIDGQALGPENFGKKVDDKWLPLDYTGTYGTNGFHLDFSEPSNLGKDSSGNNNHWTVSGPLKHMSL